jgi:YjbE family integral membrane protein
MDFFSAEFLSALLAIVVIDLVLAGDNAIVIALAARNVPAHLRTKAIVWGTFGAIAVRTAMTLAVVWLLKIPGLLAVGGVLLVWIAWKLLKNDGGDGHAISSADSFWGAMKTIVIADAVMGLDNVLAVAGAAQGNALLVVLGLLISIPIVIWGSQLILKWVERLPVIIYIGAGVLAWTAAKMILSEPLYADVLSAHPWIALATYTVIIAGVLGGGFLRNRRAVTARIDAVTLPAPAEVEVKAVPFRAAPVFEPSKGGTMLKVLLPVDVTRNAIHAARHVASRIVNGEALEVHLLHVRRPLSRHIARFLPGGDRTAFHVAEAERALLPVEAELQKFGIASQRHILRGDPARTINALAGDLAVNEIVMATARKNSLTRWVQDSVTNRVLEHAQVPVQVIAGDSVSAFERWAVPAGLGTAVAILLMAED